MKLLPLSEQEASLCGEFTHMAVLTPDSFLESAVAASAATNNTSVTFPLFTTRRGDYIPAGSGCAFILVTPFQNTADAAFNDVQVRLGDANTDNGFLTATQVNINGTEVYQKYGGGSVLPITYDSAVVVNLIVASMSGKKLSDLNSGRLLILLRLVRIPQAMRESPTGNEVAVN